MQLKRTLSVQNGSAQALAVGAAVGVALAASLYLAGLAVAQAYPLTLLGSPQDYVDELRRVGRTPPVVVAEPTVEIPAWAGLAWAGLAAALGQAVALAVWWHRPGVSFRVRGGVTAGLVWAWFSPLFFIVVSEAYVSLVARSRYWASSFGEPVGPDPFVPVYPFGAAAGLLVIVVALVPWQGIRTGYRCGWWPFASVAATLALGVALFAVGRWVVLGAV